MAVIAALLSWYILCSFMGACCNDIYLAFIKYLLHGKRRIFLLISLLRLAREYLHYAVFRNNMSNSTNSLVKNSPPSIPGTNTEHPKTTATFGEKKKDYKRNRVMFVIQVYSTRTKPVVPGIVPEGI